MTTTEIQRFSRYQIQSRRNDLVLSRVMFQTIILRLGIAKNHSWRIETDTNGKPYAVSDASKASYHVNTSDTTGMIIWAFSSHGPLGCDVELIDDDKNDVAAQCFSPDELAEYRALTAVDKQRRFYELWTLKEAVLKADGRGMAIPLSSFQFRLDPNQESSQPVLEVTDRQHGPAPHPWQFQSFRVQDRHQVAIAVATSHNVTFQCHNLYLTDYSSSFSQPWRFTLAPSEHNKGLNLEFGSYGPF